LQRPGGREAAPLQRVEDEDEFEDEDEDDYREASCMKSVADQIKSDR
jgi:hypothetical protein